MNKPLTCPGCGRVKSKSGQPWTPVTLDQHYRAVHGNPRGRRGRRVGGSRKTSAPTGLTALTEARGGA